MKQPPQPGLFDVEGRSEKLTAMGDPLDRLDGVIQWELFREDLQRVWDKERKSKAGAKPFDVRLMSKMLTLQRHYGLLDEQLEHQVCGWSFKEALVRLDLTEVLFSRFDVRLGAWRRKRGSRVGVLITHKGVDGFFTQIEVDTANSKVHCRQSPCGWVGFLSIDGNIA